MANREKVSEERKMEGKLYFLTLLDSLSLNKYVYLYCIILKNQRKNTKPEKKKRI